MEISTGRQRLALGVSSPLMSFYFIFYKHMLFTKLQDHAIAYYINDSKSQSNQCTAKAMIQNFLSGANKLSNENKSQLLKSIQSFAGKNNFQTIDGRSFCTIPHSVTTLRTPTAYQCQCIATMMSRFALNHQHAVGVVMMMTGLYNLV